MIEMKSNQYREDHVCINRRREKKMGSRARKHVWDRVMSCALSAIMVLGLLPVSFSDLFAAEPDPIIDRSSGVTIHLTDRYGTAISDATINYSCVANSSETGFTPIEGVATPIGDGYYFVIPKEDYVAELQLEATINKSGYHEHIIDPTAVTSDTESISAVLFRTTSEITVKGRIVDYNYTSNDPEYLVDVNNASDYTVQYKVDQASDWSDKAQAKAPGDYKVAVKISENEYGTATYDTVESTINEIDVFSYVNPCGNFTYDGNERNSISNYSLKQNYNGWEWIDGSFQSRVKVSYQLNTNLETTSVPRIKDAGKYTVQIFARDAKFDNVIISRKMYTVIVSPQSVPSNVMNNIRGYEGEYDGASHIPIQSIPDNYYVSYSTVTTLPYNFDTDYNWQTDTLITDVDEYIFLVKATRIDNDNIYSIKEVTAKISKASQIISFKNGWESNGSSSESYSANDLPKQYDFSLQQGSENATYTLSGPNGESILTDDAELTVDGMLIVNKHGTYKITVTKTGDGNNEPATIFHTLNILKPSGINFPKGSISYTIGSNWTEGNSEIISNQKAVKDNVDDPKIITYGLANPVAGLDCDPDGVLSVTDYAALLNILHNSPSKSVVVEIIAKKPAGSVFAYAEDKYSVTISFLDTPESPYSIDLTLPIDGYYPGPIQVIPKTDYKISKTFLPSSFTDKVDINESGDYIVYLRDTVTGGITDKINISGIKIDTSTPESMGISLSNTQNKYGSYWYYKEPFTATFVAISKDSGIQKFDWVFLCDIEDGETTQKKIEGTITDFNITSFPGNKSSYSASITLPGEYLELQGVLSFTATKLNKNSSTYDLDTVKIVYDETNPTCTYTIGDENGERKDTGNHLYFNSNVTINVLMTEKNFDPNQCKLKVTKDDTDEETLNWDGSIDDIMSGSFVFEDEGKYHVEVICIDKAGNEMEPYVLPEFTIDKTAPSMEIGYDAERQIVIFSIEEKNFRKEDVVMQVTTTDINGNPINLNYPENYLQSLDWKKENDKHTVEVSFQDAIYAFAMKYNDLSSNGAEVSKSGVVIDHVAPATSDIKIDYSIAIHEQIFQLITFGFYNPSVTVTFTAKDSISGVDHFDWTFTPKTDSGDGNVTSISGILPAEVTGDKDTFTANLVLSAEQYDQMKGSISVTATDKMKNESTRITDDEKVIVVDTISPTMKVEYSPADRTVNKDMYYQGVVTATLTVTEANFYAENIIVTATRNGGDPFVITPAWADASTKETPDLHIGTFTLAAPADQSGDGDYVITITYGDFSGNQMKGDESIKSGVYTSERITIDTLAPTVNVSYSNSNAVNVTKDPTGNVRSYFAAEQVATITVREHNFKAEEVQFVITAEDISGKPLDLNTFLKRSEWVSTGDTHTIVFTYPGDANYSFDLEYKDTANNAIADRPVDYFTVDKTVPENLTIAYSESLLDIILENISFGFYNAKTTVTITADDSVSGVFGISYNGNQASQNVSYSNANKTATLVFELPGSSADSQYDGYVDFNVQDRSGNKAGKKDDKRIIVDSISPTASVTYNQPALLENRISYYDGEIQGQIMINEANFFAKDVNVTVSKDGESATSLNTNWASPDKDTHVGSFTLTEDGDYVVSVSYTDNSKNSMTSYTSQVMKIDTLINKPTIQFNGKTESGKAYRDDLIPGVSIEDRNYKTYDISLTRTSFGTKNEDVTDLFVKEVTESETGVSGTFDTFEKIQENDGIYKMTVSVEDKAGNTATSTAFFTVNRFGSVYEYSDYLASLVKDGGAYVSSITEDLIIMEYNPDQVLKDSLQIEVTRDGKPLTDLIFDTSEIKNEITASEDGGWYQYQYSIGKDNFIQDGVYKISISTIDATGNTMENNKSAENAIIFHIDNEAPEITSVRGLEREIIDATKLEVEYTVYDTIGLKSVQVFVNGVEEGGAVTDFSGDLNNYTGSFSMKESGVQQSVRIVVEDLAGNITDTDSTTFKSAFAFRKNVTISTNFFVRWYANTPLFWGSSIAVVALVGVLVALILKRRLRPRRKN